MCLARKHVMFTLCFVCIQVQIQCLRLSSSRPTSRRRGGAMPKDSLQQETLCRNLKTRPPTRSFHVLRTDSKHTQVQTMDT